MVTTGVLSPGSGSCGAAFIVPAVPLMLVVVILGCGGSLGTVRSDQICVVGAVGGRVLEAGRASLSISSWAVLRYYVGFEDPGVPGAPFATTGRYSLRSFTWPSLVGFEESESTQTTPFWCSTRHQQARGKRLATLARAVVRPGRGRRLRDGQRSLRQRATGGVLQGITSPMSVRYLLLAR